MSLRSPGARQRQAGMWKERGLLSLFERAMPDARLLIVIEFL